MRAMSYKVTLEVYVNGETTTPRILVESWKGFVNEAAPVYDDSDTTKDTEALEGVLTKTREFAQTLVSGVEVVGHRESVA